MAIDPTIAVLYAQTNFAARFSHDAAVAPHTASAMSRIMAEEVARLEHQQVQKTEKSGEMQVGEDGSGKGQERAFGSRRRQRQLVPDDESETASLNDSPLVGNLLNIKV